MTTDLVSEIIPSETEEWTKSIPQEPHQALQHVQGLYHARLRGQASTPLALRQVDQHLRIAANPP